MLNELYRMSVGSGVWPPRRSSNQDPPRLTVQLFTDSCAHSSEVVRRASRSWRVGGLLHRSMAGPTSEES